MFLSLSADASTAVGYSRDAPACLLEPGKAHAKGGAGGFDCDGICAIVGGTFTTVDV